MSDVRHVHPNRHNPGAVARVQFFSDGERTVKSLRRRYSTEYGSHPHAGAIRGEIVSVAAKVDSDTQLARLLQIGIVLEDVVEARAARHYRRLPESQRHRTVEELLAAAQSESEAHRDRLATIVDELEAESVPTDRVKTLVAEQYAPPGDTDGVLYDQLHGEETAYKFYDDLVTAIEEGDASFSVDRERVLAVLRDLREDEADGVEAVTKLMEQTDGGSP